jgi:mono/diheme cytochrome c family protein
MRKFKKILKWTGIIILIIIAGLYITILALQNKKFDAPYVNIKASMDSTVIARGKELIYGPAHCVNCHSAKGSEELVMAGKEVPLTGGHLFDLPIGKIYSRNLTPDMTGIGRMSDAEFGRALRYGVSPEGKAYFDFMPFHNTSDEDLGAIISYLRSQQPVKYAVPANEFNLLGKAVRAFMLKPVGPEGAVEKSVKRDTTAVYGKYLANSVANCRGCHTNRDLMTGAFIGEDYAGGLKFETPTDSGMYSLTTPNLTPDASGRLYGWTQQQFIDRFRKGTLIRQSHMPWGPFSHMSDDDLKAVWNFLQTVKPVQNKVPIGLVKEKS